MRGRYFWILTALWAGLSGAASGTDGGAGAAPSVALVIRIVGEATRERPGTPRAEPLELLDRLGAGTAVSTAAASRVTLVFFDGQRFAVEAESRIVVEGSGVRTEAGAARRLEGVPALAEIPRLDLSTRPGGRPGASRIRTSELVAPADLRLYPREAAAVLRDEATLSFTPIAGVGEYRVEVVDVAGRLVVSVRTREGEVRLPHGVLEPGAFYSWQVSTRAEQGWRLRGTALFRTLADEDARAHRRLAEATRSGDPALLLLRAEVERGLGLRRQACDLLARAAASDPDAVVSDRIVARFGCAENLGPAAQF